MKKIISLIVAALLAVSCFALAACSQEPAGDADQPGDANASGDGETLKIGLLAPLTGEVAEYGVAVANGVRLYVEEYNAAGGMSPDFSIGDLMIITDHINFFPEHPLHGKNIPYGPRFPDMSEAYDRELIRKADAIAAEKGIKVQHGVYIGTQGPTFETPAEYRMFHILGADAVGMSTVPEVIVANHCGIKVFGISVITDLGVEGKIVEVSHEEVQKAADAAQPKMTEIMRELINRA